MKKQANRWAIVISAAFTLLLLTFVGGGLLMVNRIFAQSRDSQVAPAQPSVSQDVAFAQPADASAVATTSDAQVIAAYKAQLNQAYKDLNDAYAQIEALQAAQAQPAAPAFFGESEHEREGHSQRGDLIVLQPTEFDHD